MTDSHAGAEMDAGTEALLDRIGGRFPPSNALSPAGARAALRATFPDPGGETPGVAATRDLLLDGPGGDLPVRAYDPTADDPPVLVYFHGGGWVRGDVDTHDELCRDLCRRTRALVCSVDYRRAPEHPFPAAFADCYAATAWAADHAGSLGADPSRLAVAGDSAGGNLAAAVALRARDADGPAVSHQGLLYPVIRRELDTDSYHDHADDGLLTRAAMDWYWERYLPADLHAHNPYAVPARAPTLADLPPATVVTAGFDPLRDEGTAYAERLREAGVAVETRDYPTTVHAFLSFPDLDVAAAGRAAFAADVRDALGVAEQPAE